jgi:hypothetical protein
MVAQILHMFSGKIPYGRVIQLSPAFLVNVVSNPELVLACEDNM